MLYVFHPNPFRIHFRDNALRKSRTRETSAKDYTYPSSIINNLDILFLSELESKSFPYEIFFFTRGAHVNWFSMRYHILQRARREMGQATRGRE